MNCFTNPSNHCRGLAIAFTLLICVLAESVHADGPYKGNLKHVLGDVKQGQIQNKLDTTTKVDNVLDGLEKLGCNGVRITIFPKGTNPNPEMFDYLYQQAKKRGLKIFANSAQDSGGRRVASRSLTPSPVKNDLKATNILIRDVKEFGKEYPCDWINPFNEDAIDVGGFTGPQMQYVYQKLYRRVGGADLIGPCTWGIPAGIKVLKRTTIHKYITVATTHNLGFNHDKWPEFIALAKIRKLPVWDSEVTFHRKYPEKPNRFDVAMEAKVDGLVLYHAWTLFVKLHTGDLSKSGLSVRDRILKNPDQQRLKPGKYEPQEGDLLFQYAEGNEILNALADANGDKFSHCGMLVKKDGSWFVLEASTTVTETPINVWRQRSRDKLMHVYRLRESQQKHIPKMIEIARKLLGRPHDPTCQITDAQIYGPELVYKSFRRSAGKVLTPYVLLEQLQWKPVEAVILKQEAPVPLRRKIVTAEHLSKSGQLQWVYSSKKTKSGKTTN